MRLLVLICLLFGVLGSLETKNKLVECEVCREVFREAQKWALDPNIWEYPIDIAVEICKKFEGYTIPVCLGAIKENVLIVTGSIARHYLDPEWACSMLEFCDSPKYVKENFTEWQDNILQSKPSAPAPTPSGQGTYKFGHISDLHIDIYYQEGTNNNCGLPVCCRSWNGPGNSGYWGDLQCDLPVRTLEVTLDQMSQIDLDFLIVTGDIPAHDVWNQSLSYNLNYQQVVADLFEKYFPTTPIYYMFGNHGPFPVNNLDPRNSSVFIDPFTQIWSNWLDAQAIETLKSTWTYSMVHPGTNLKMVAINTQACNNDNFFLLENATDPMGQIQWLAKELAAAEQSGQVVYLFSHIPIESGDCLDDWAAHVNALVDRYSNTIAGQFYGHTHKDQWSITRGVKSLTPLSVQWAAPSVTTYQGMNPSFRVYEADTVTKLVTDIHQYRLNLTAANENPSVTPTFELAYSFLDYYGLPDLQPQTLLDFANTWMANETRSLQYLDAYYGVPGAQTSCDQNCRLVLVCDRIWGTNALQSICTGTPEYGLINGLYIALFGPWVYKQ
ncbi:unnamed protein product [Blepharisma stoltei]|uniref:Sphingomyelin phosphodiesterase n=1 Tax=Blepharisma stoltei TaxID=1481888 RepID=A0AAU9JMW6_9CILI|nr:unnamed protein product [Blepharisma stoltei]